MNQRICIFAGTKDGRELAELLASHGLDVTACSATEYGGELLETSGSLKVRTGRMDESEMREFFCKEDFELIIDATHPYAQIVTQNIAFAAKEAGVEYLRLLRAQEEVPVDAVYMENTAEAVEFLSGTEGQILLTTGSKELSSYSLIPGFNERVWARVLPLKSSLEQAEEAGLPPGRIIAMQGPFTKEMNEAMISMTNASYLVSKMSGKIGGFREKIDACAGLGIKAVVIGRPPEEEGLSFDEMARLIFNRYLNDSFNGSIIGSINDSKKDLINDSMVESINDDETEAGNKLSANIIGKMEKESLKENKPSKRAAVVGIGMGTYETMTEEAVRVVRSPEYQCLIGAKRMLDSVKDLGKPSIQEIAPEKIMEAIESHPEYDGFSILMSGDTGFFSGTKKLLPLLKEKGFEVKVYPGISSMSYLASRAGISYDDCKMVSLHGRERNIAYDVRTNKKVLCLVGGSDGTSDLIETLINAGLQNVMLHVGERLGYEDEKVTSGRASELKGRSFDSLSAVIIENDQTEEPLKFGLPDEAFQRGGDASGVVPMTKSEVRAAVLSKLKLKSDSVCWDIGAGTGSVSIEMALNAPYGTVYAIEKKEKALELLSDNIAKFGVSNCIAIPGAAPEALVDLPAPTHVFIGGSSGNMKDIIDLILAKNPEARIIASAVSLETVGELAYIIKDYGFTDREAVCLNVARAREIGNYNLMMGQNPIYIFTMQRVNVEETKC